MEGQCDVEDVPKARMTSGIESKAGCAGVESGSEASAWPLGPCVLCAGMLGR